jgi:hypothetical protein
MVVSPLVGNITIQYVVGNITIQYVVGNITIQYVWLMVVSPLVGQ